MSLFGALVFVPMGFPSILFLFLQEEHVFIIMKYIWSSLDEAWCVLLLFFMARSIITPVRGRGSSYDDESRRKHSKGSVSEIFLLGFHRGRRLLHKSCKICEVVAAVVVVFIFFINARSGGGDDLLNEKFK